LIATWEHLFCCSSSVGLLLQITRLAVPAGFPDKGPARRASVDELTALSYRSAVLVQWNSKAVLREPCTLHAEVR